MSSQLEEKICRAIVYIKTSSYVYDLECLNRNYPIEFQFGHAIVGRRLHKQCVVFSWMRATLNLRRLVFRTVEKIFENSHATKTILYYPYPSLLSHAVQKFFRHFEFRRRESSTVTDTTSPQYVFPTCFYVIRSEITSVP